MSALILLPLAGGVPFLFLPFLKQKRVGNVWLCAVLVLETVLAAGFVFKLSQQFELGTSPSFLLLQVSDDSQLLKNEVNGLSFTLKADGLSRLFLLLFSGMWLCAGLYSLEYMEHEKQTARFYGFFLMTLSSLIGIALSANMLTLYLFYEGMTLLSLPLVLHNQTPEAKKAGLKYLFYSVAGAFLALGGMMLVYYGGELSLDFINKGRYYAISCPVGEDTSLAVGRQGAAILIGSFLMIVGFGTKAGMFPMQSWLPTAHPVAPAPASAVLSGVITKTGVLAVIRLIYNIVGIRMIFGSWVQFAWLALAMITVFLGSMLAYKEQNLKKRLAFSTVSQVSYIMFGLATLNWWGVLGALLHVIFHSMVKNTLFFSAGSIIHHTGKTKVEELTGIGKEMPVTLWCFTLVGITLVGIPPTSAFISKWFLAKGALNYTGKFSLFPAIFSYGGPIVLLLSALLTAGYLVTISMRGFLPGAEFDYASVKKREAGWRMLAPMLVLTTGAVLLGIYVQPLLGFLEQLILMELI